MSSDDADPRAANPAARGSAATNATTTTLIDSDVNPSASQKIDLVLPARASMASTLRLLCASLGADIGMSVDEIDDLRLAASEVLVSASDTPSCRLAVSFDASHCSLSLSFSVVGGGPIELDELATTILRSSVDDVLIDGTSISFVKRCAEVSDEIRR